MTKFFKKVFICGILLSSVGAYSNDGGVLADLYPKLSDGNLTLTESSLTINDNVTTHNDIVIGALDDNIITKTVDESNNNILKATNLPVAKTDDGIVWKYSDDSSALDIIPVGGENAVYRLYGTDNKYICSINDVEDVENKLYEKYDGKWYANSDNGNDLTTVGDTEVIVIDLASNTEYSLASGDKPNLLFTGTLATQGTDGKWYKGTDTTSSDKLSLPKVQLTIEDGKTLTIGNKITHLTNQPVTKLDGEDALANTTVDYDKNEQASIIFTEFSEILSGSNAKLVLSNAGPDNYVHLNSNTTDINNSVKETTVILEPGCSIGTTNLPLQIEQGTTDLSKYFTTTTDTETEKTLLEGNSTAGALLNAEINGKVDIFSQIIPLDTTGDAKSEMIGLVNNSNISQVFPNITSQSGGQITLEVPYTYNIDGGSAYNSLEDISDNVQANNKVVINLVSKDKLAGLFKNGTEIDYKMNGKNTENISELIDNTIAYAHNIDGTSTTDVYLDVSSLKKFDNTFKSDEYLYSGLEGAKKLNVIPLDGDAFVIPCNDKSESTSPGDTVSAFNLIASTDKNSDVIKKYIEPNMNDTKVKTATGEALDPQPATITYSTKLSKVGASDSKKTLLLNSLNNTRNRKVLLDESYLNVKSKDNNDINIGTLELNNGSEITLFGTNTVQNLVMDPTSKLRIRGKFIWGSAAV